MTDVATLTSGQIRFASLTDPKRQKLSIAEATRPARQLISNHQKKHRKSQGRKKVKGAELAIYHNWFTPLCWSIITEAARIVGPDMSPTRIVKTCQAREPEIFRGLRRETVKGWIDRSGDRPRWSDAVVRRAEIGNAPGHANGGRRGILVSTSHNNQGQGTYMSR
jgi:hypothetical protein